MTKSNKRKLGAWFPSASVIKAQEYGENSRISLLLFYHYVTPQKWSEAKKQSAIAWVEQAGERLNLGGSVPNGMRRDELHDQRYGGRH